MTEKKSFSEKWAIPIAVTAIGGLMVAIIQKGCIDADDLNEKTTQIAQTNNNYYGTNTNNSEAITPKQEKKYDQIAERPSIEYVVAKENEKTKVVTPELFINNLPARDVMVVIIEEGSISSALSSKIAAIYKEKGIDAGTGLFKQDFITSRYFEQLKNGDVDVFQKLMLNKYAQKYIIGTLSSTILKNDEALDVYTASLSVNIISINGIIDAFEIPDISANHATLSRAKNDAIIRLLQKYTKDHSLL